jgi:hypothetical protein
MHHLELGHGWSADCSSDFTGNVLLVKAGGVKPAHEIEVPMEVLICLVGEMKRAQVVSDLEQMDVEKILGSKQAKRSNL